MELACLSGLVVVDSLAELPPPIRWLLVIEALTSLLWGRWLCNMPIARWIRMAGLQVALQEPVDSPHGQIADPELTAIARHLGGVARRVPWRADCLPQALAAVQMLARRGYRPVLHLGARLTRDLSDAASPGLNAHAWVVCNGVVVSGGPAHLAYVPVSSWAKRSADAGVQP